MFLKEIKQKVKKLDVLLKLFQFLMLLKKHYVRGKGTRKKIILNFQ